MRNDSGDSLEVSHVLSPISIKPPALLDASIVSNSYSGQLTENSNGYKLMSSMHTIHASTKGIKLNLVFSGETPYVNTTIDLGAETSESAFLAIESSQRVTGTIKDKRISNYPIFVEGTLVKGPETMNVLGTLYTPGAEIE